MKTLFIKEEHLLKPCGEKEKIFVISACKTIEGHDIRGNELLNATNKVLFVTDVLKRRLGINHNYKEYCFLYPGQKLYINNEYSMSEDEKCKYNLAWNIC